MFLVAPSKKLMPSHYTLRVMASQIQVFICLWGAKDNILDRKSVSRGTQTDT